MSKYTYYVYIVTNNSNSVIYVGFTNNMSRRLEEHKSLTCDGFTRRYKATKLVYYETYNEVETAIAREKQLKGWLRSRKIALVTEHNPEWNEVEI